jgi:hypothetical protein
MSPANAPRRRLTAKCDGLPHQGGYTVMFFDFMLHPVAFVAWEAAGWPESPPAAVGIVKERGGSPAEHLAASAESLFGGLDILCPTSE